jgi:hypothetical protein
LKQLLDFDSTCMTPIGLAICEERSVNLEASREVLITTYALNIAGHNLLCAPTALERTKSNTSCSSDRVSTFVIRRIEVLSQTLEREKMISDVGERLCSLRQPHFMQVLSGTSVRMTGEVGAKLCH